MSRDIRLEPRSDGEIFQRRLTYEIRPSPGKPEAENAVSAASFVEQDLLRGGANDVRKVAVSGEGAQLANPQKLDERQRDVDRDRRIRDERELDLRLADPLPRLRDLLKQIRVQVTHQAEGLDLGERDRLAVQDRHRHELVDVGDEDASLLLRSLLR